MSIWSEFGKRLGSARQNIKPPKISGPLRVINVRRKGEKKAEKPGRKKYEYCEPEASVLLNQRAVGDRLKGGEKPEEALGDLRGI